VKRRFSRLILSGLSLTFFSSVALADTITFKNGHEVHGRLVEETSDYVIFQVGNGRLKFAKRDIATFTEDADYGQRYFAPPKRSEDAGGETTMADGKVRRWTEHKDATSDERKDLRAVHTRIAEELGKVGTSADERDRKLQLSGADRTSLDAALSDLGKPGRARFDFSQFGPKAIGPISDVLANGSTVARTDAAVAIADAITRGDVEDVKWALGRNKVGTKLVALLDLSGDAASAAARNAANATLEAIAGTSVGWSDSKEPSPTETQRNATTKWKEWAAKDAAAFEASDKDRDAQRKKHEDAWQALENASSWRRALAEAVDTYGTTTTKSGDKTDATKPGDKTDVTATNPDIAKEATPDEQKRLVELKGKVKTTLDKVVGPTLEERKAKYQLTSDERQSLNVVLHNLQQSGTRGSQNLIRQNAANELTTYGLKALPLLAEALTSDNVYGRWSAAGAIEKIAGSADKDDVRTLVDAYDVPTKLAALLEEQSDGRAAYVRADAAKALAAVSGNSTITWPENKDKAVSPEESEARSAWTAWASRESSEFQRVERAREDHRKALNEVLKKLDGARSWQDAMVAAPKAIEKAERELKR
jgi:hypothetical protein